MRPLLLSIGLFGALCTRALAGPGIVGNGGDAVLCRDANGSPFKGYYSLDYLLTFDTRTDNRDVTPAFTWEESRDRIQALLDAKHPDLAYSFRSFVADMDNSFDYSRHRIWHEAGFGLVDVKDERIIRKLPANCYDLRADGSIQITQAVIQEQRPDLFVFDFDPAVYDEFKRLAPLQFSFLMVHEWLWEWTDDVHVVRDANRFLHSATAGGLNADAFSQALKAMGLKMRPAAYKPICDRPETVRTALEEAFGKACGTLTDADTNWLPDYYKHGVEVVSDGKPLVWLGIDDLGGLAAVAQLELKNAGLEHLNAKELVNMPRLAILDLSGNALTSEDGLLDELSPAMERISLASNQLTSFPKHFLTTPSDYGACIPVDEYDPQFVLDLSHNRLRTAVVDSPHPMHFQKIDLSFNQLSTLDRSLCALACQKSTLIVSGNPALTDASVDAFHAACPAFHIIKE
jgi:hypothetical protein